MNIGPIFADPAARMLYAEIASIEEQHVTQYESLVDPTETWMEKWLLHECNEVYTYWSCLQQEPNPRLKSVWDRMLSYELGHLHYVMDLMKQIDRRDPAELLPATLPEPIKYESQRDFVRETLNNEVGLRAVGTSFVPQDSAESLAYRDALAAEGAATELITVDYQYTPGTELNRPESAIH